MLLVRLFSPPTLADAGRIVPCFPLFFSGAYVRSSRWRAPTDRKRLTHAAEEEEDLPLEELQDAEEAGEGGEAPPGAMPTGEGSVEPASCLIDFAGGGVCRCGGCRG